MEPNRTIKEAAREFIEAHGEQAVEVLRQLAKTAADLGDSVAAETWRKIAEAAEQQLQAASN